MYDCMYVCTYGSTVCMYDCMYIYVCMCIWKHCIYVHIEALYVCTTVCISVHMNARMYTTCTASTQRGQRKLRQGIGALETGVLDTDGCGMSYKSFELCLGRIEEQLLLLTTESFLQFINGFKSSSSGRQSDLWQQPVLLQGNFLEHKTAKLKERLHTTDTWFLFWSMCLHGRSLVPKMEKSSAKCWVLSAKC